MQQLLIAMALIDTARRFVLCTCGASLPPRFLTSVAYSPGTFCT